MGQNHRIHFNSWKETHVFKCGYYMTTQSESCGNCIRRFAHRALSVPCSSIDMTNSSNHLHSQSSNFNGYLSLQLYMFVQEGFRLPVYIEMQTDCQGQYSQEALIPVCLHVLPGETCAYRRTNAHRIKF